MKIGRRLGARLVVAAAIAAGVGVWACADSGNAPTWELAKDYYDSGGNGAMLTPGNDTRANLFLLLADRRGTAVRHPGGHPKGPPLVLFPWSTMSEAARPPVAPDAEPTSWSASRCDSNAAGAAAFVAALRASREVPDEEKRGLEAARLGLAPSCSGESSRPGVVTVSSPAGRAFAEYLKGAGDFYAGDFAAARAGFQALTGARDPWLREAALYMAARSELNRAQQSAFDEYGSLVEPAERDRAAIAAAAAAFASYLRAYPQAAYSASARGLTRRVAWLAGDHEELAAGFARQIAGAGPLEGAADAVALANEVDLALLESGGGAAARDPLLVAVVDLQRMRCVDDYETPAEDCGERIGREELERQAPLFAGERPLFDYLRAAHAFFVRKEPREVLSLIPDAARQPRFSYLEFSRQTLRGMALEATEDRNARAFWLSLFAGAVQPYQREALELALALHDERSGQIGRIFAADSQVRHPLMRQMLLEYVAGPDLLRQQARNAAVPKQERDVATYILLAKELRRGLYRDFLDDLSLVPPGASEDGYFASALQWEAGYNPELTPPPLGRFAARARLGDADCPPLRTTVEALAGAPRAVGPRLCLAEFFRSNDFDWFQFDERLAGRGLATSKPQFHGAPYHRLEVYKSIIDDPAATADQRALALNRAIRCYAPSGNNSCGGTEVSVEQRASWFQRLKRDHPNSRWAKSLRYYW
jgi:hypothetical protein